MTPAIEWITPVRECLAELARLAGGGEREAFRQGLWAHAEKIRRYLLSFQLEGTPSGFTEQYVNDALARFLRTLGLVPLPLGGHILEIGSNPYFFQLLLRKFFPESIIAGSNFFDHNIFSTDVRLLSQRISSTEFDESYDFKSILFNLETVPEYPYAADSFDLVLFCETLEHLVVDPLATFSRIRRIVRPGGHLLVTLPNAVRLTNVALMLDGYNLFDVYSTNGPHGRHNREYTLEEMVNLLEHNGYRIVRAETHDRCDYDIVDIWSSDYTGRSLRLDRKKTQLLGILCAAGASVENRGDNLYVLAQRAD
jgi:SAM-dependent methyltransferase